MAVGYETLAVGGNASNVVWLQLATDSRGFPEDPSNRTAAAS